MEPWRPRTIPINPDRIAKLAQLGLNVQQARAYLALLDAESATANEIAKSSRVPRAKLYEVLDTLGRKGLLEVIPETPQRFRANPLTALYDTRLAELRSEERQLKSTIGELMVQLLPGMGVRASEPDRDFLHLVRGRAALTNAFRQLVENAQTKLHIIGDILFFSRIRVLESTYAKLAEFASAGKLRIVVPSNVVRALDGRKVHVDELADAVRILPFPLGDALVGIRDQSEVLEAHLLPNDLHPSQGSDRVVVHRDPALSATLANIVDGLWQQASPYVSGLAARK